jgi:hypothetical protein
VIAVMGNYERECLDSSDNSSPTVSFATVLMAIAVAAKRKMRKRLYDVAGAYLYADLEENKFMKLGKDIVKVVIQ